LVSIGEEWKSRIEQVTKCPVEIVLEIKKKPAAF